MIYFNDIETGVGPFGSPGHGHDPASLPICVRMTLKRYFPAKGPTRTRGPHRAPPACAPQQGTQTQCGGTGLLQKVLRHPVGGKVRLLVPADSPRGVTHPEPEPLFIGGGSGVGGRFLQEESG